MLRPNWLLTVLLFAICRLQAFAAEQPNIVFLMADDQCTLSMGCYGNDEVKTPNMDDLARRGMTFDNHYATTAICMASRASAVTGLLEYKHGCNFEHGPLLQAHWAQSFPVLLRAAGYKTAFAGKVGFEVAPEPAAKGQLPESDFDWWGGSPGQTSYNTRQNKSMLRYADDYPHSTLSYGAFGRDFIAEASKGDQPFCLSISFKAPHHPVQPDPKFADVYRGSIFTKPANYGRQYSEHFSLQSRQGRQFARFDDWRYSTDYDQVMALYYQQIYAIDVAVGMITNALEAQGVADNTIVIYTSDNGFLCGSHGYASKVLPYEEASRVPLIVVDPRSATRGGGFRCKSLTGNIDIAATILDLAGIAPPETMDGKSLTALLDHPAGEVHSHLPLINVWGPQAVHSLAVVTRDWKYIYWPYDKGQFTKTEELYCTQEDPYELTNLATDSEAAEQLVAMQQLYDSVVADWQPSAVPYHKYGDFADIFRRQKVAD